MARLRACPSTWGTEVGEQLGITAGNVGVILNRAKAALRERLTSHGPASDLREMKRRLGNEQRKPSRRRRHSGSCDGGFAERGRV
jgi:hypothetical protein